MAKIHLYGEDYEIFEKETAMQVARGDLIVSPAQVLVLQTPDRKEALVAFVGVGGEAYILPTSASRIASETEEFLKAYATVQEK